MKRSTYTIAALLGFLLGVGLFLLWQPVGSVIAWGLGLGLLLFLGGKIFRSYMGLGGVIVIFLFLGLGRAIFSVHPVTPAEVDFYNGQKVTLEGIIRQVDARQDQVKYTVSVVGPVVGQSPMELDSTQSRTPEDKGNEEALRLDVYRASERQPEAIQTKGKVLVSLDRFPRYAYGDKIRIIGELREPGVIDDFNYGNYLSRYDIYSVMYRPKVELLESGLGNPFWASMVKLQDKFLAQISRLFPEPFASFEAGLLVGARKGIPEELMEKFNITGLTHIIAISGYNITIIIVFVMWLLRRLPRRAQFFVAVTSIVLFTLFVGASPAVVRASIMGILGLIALQAGRQSNIHITVLFAAALMVLWNPKTLWWDVGFQLSFAAVLGLIYVAPWFDAWAKKLPEAFGIREAIQMTLSAQVTALPIIVYNFGRLSLISPLSNLLVAFAIPPAMAFGFAGVLLSFLWLPLGLPLAYVAYGVLLYIIKMIELTAAIPYASVNVGMSLWMMLGYYVLLIGLLTWRNSWKKEQTLVLEEDKNGPQNFSVEKSGEAIT